MINKNFQPRHTNQRPVFAHLDCLVDFEQHGKVQYAIIRKDLGKKFQVETEQGEFLNLTEDRIHMYPEKKFGDNIQALKQFALAIRDAASKINLELLSRALEDKKDFSTFSEIVSVYREHLGQGTPFDVKDLAAFRASLLMDKIYFKREQGKFKAKPLDEVNAAKAVSERNLQQESEILSLTLALKKKLRGETKVHIPQTIDKLIYVAALGKKYPEAKLFVSMIENLSHEVGITDKKVPLEDRALAILLKSGHIDERFNLTPYKVGRPITFNTEEREAAEKINQQSKIKSDDGRAHFEDLFVCTIDSSSTQDFDDAISYEELENSVRIGIHITDVSEQIRSNDTLEATAKRRATSIYCPDITYPMLPLSLSEGGLSLKEGFERPSISFFITFDKNNNVTSREIKRTSIKVHKRYSYDEVDSQLEDNASESFFKKVVALTEALEQKRSNQGAIMFPRRDLAPDLSPDGKVKLVSNTDDTPARKMISELMILANETAALFADENAIPFLYRTQGKPEGNIEELAEKFPEGPGREYARRSLLKRSEVKTTPEGHSSLGVTHYCQVTSPIRRYVDLVLIRQLSTYLKDNSIAYSSSDLESLLKEIEPNLDEASLIQRDRNRYWLLKYIEQQKFSVLKGTLVKIDGPRPLAEIDDMHCIFSFQSIKDAPDFRSRLKVGDALSLKITKLIPHKDKLYLQEI